MNETYFKEIQLSRDLARAIEIELAMYGQVIPQSVFQAYLKLKEHYDDQIAQGIQ